jgi:hypothetical protein
LRFISFFHVSAVDFKLKITNQNIYYTILNSAGFQFFVNNKIIIINFTGSGDRVIKVTHCDYTRKTFMKHKHTFRRDLVDAIKKRRGAGGKEEESSSNGIDTTILK